jgi:hypothetical protein
LFRARILYKIDPELERKVVNIWGMLSTDTRTQIDHIWLAAGAVYHTDAGIDLLEEQ